MSSAHLETACCDGELRELHRVYHRERANVAFDEFCAKLRRGFVLIDDLDLERALKVVEGNGEPAPGVADQPTAWLQALIDRLSALSMQDGLTGMFNRRYFDLRIDREVKRSRREKRPCSVMLVDIDHFKSVNDRFGHAGGDAALRVIASVLQDVLRSTDEVTTRVGGEEFAVILPGTDAPGALIAAERVRERFAACKIPLGESPISLTLSAGVTTYEPELDAAVSPDQLIARADTALYAAKNQGRNRVHVYSRTTPPVDGGVSQQEKDALFK